MDKKIQTIKIEPLGQNVVANLDTLAGIVQKEVSKQIDERLGGGNGGNGEMEKRVEQLEKDVRALRDDAIWIKERLGHTATKADIKDIQIQVGESLDKQLKWIIGIVLAAVVAVAAVVVATLIPA